jgi:hypothetical protein
MATLATLYNRVVGVKPYEAVLTRATRVADDPYALRAIANEDIYFYVKDINNMRVVRADDPQAKASCWKLIASAGAAAVLLIGVLLPSAYGLLAGYQLESLKQEQTRLNAERSAAELEEARLLSPARLDELARAQSFVDPPSQSVVYLDGNKGSLALNVKK